MAKFVSDERIICADCGCHLKRSKAIQGAEVKYAGKNIFQVFCKSCAKKRGLPEPKPKPNYTALVAVIIIITTILLWEWFKISRSINWIIVIILISYIVLWFLFSLYNRIK